LCLDLGKEVKIDLGAERAVMTIRIYKKIKKIKPVIEILNLENLFTICRCCSSFLRYTLPQLNPDKELCKGQSRNIHQELSRCKKSHRAFQMLKKRGGLVWDARLCKSNSAIQHLEGTLLVPTPQSTHTLGVKKTQPRHT